MSAILTLGREAAEMILTDYFHIDVRKALNPLNMHDFVTIVKQIGATLAGHVVPVEHKAIKEAVDALDVDWHALPKEARWTLIDHVTNEYLVPVAEKVMPKIDQATNFYAKDLVHSSKSNAIHKYNLKIEPNLNAFDQSVITHVGSQGHYIRDHLGERRAAFSYTARNIVSDGLEAGLGSSDIAANLHEKLSQDSGRGRGYWDMIAMVFANRARTMAQLGSFHEAGIVAYQWESVMDEVTSVQCRFLHGRVFPVAKAMETFDQVAGLDDPEDISLMAPFVNHGMVDGKPALYIGSKKKDDHVVIANVDHNAVGTKDAPGKFSNAKTTEALIGFGIQTPPIHGRCRSTIIPEMGTLEHPPAAVGAPMQVPGEPVEVPRPSVPRIVPPAPPATIPAVALPEGFGDPDATLTFGKSSPHEGIPLNGIPLKHADAPDFTKIKTVDVDEGPMPSGTISTGVVVVEPDGRIWVVEPKDHYGGYEHTYPKGKMDSYSGLTPQQNALKELYEEAGLTGEIKGVIGDFKGMTGTTRYYIAHRTGGTPTDAHWESATVKLASMKSAESLLNVQRDKDVLAALKKKLSDHPASLLPSAPAYVPPVPPEPKKPKKPSAPKKPKPVIAPTEVSPSLTQDVIMGQLQGGAKGSNDGGFYRGTDGVNRYVKFYDNALQANGEHLANSLYRDLGVAAPKSHLFEATIMENGAPRKVFAYASDIIEGGETLARAGLTKARARSFMKGFIGDVLMQNWDAVGTGMDNAFVVGDEVTRIDNGGSFLLRAQGERKHAHQIADIGEWESFFEPGRDYGKVAKAAGYSSVNDFKKDAADQIKRMIAVRDANGGWAKYIDKVAPAMSSADRADVLGMLNNRSKLLEEKLPTLVTPRKPRGVPAAAPEAGERSVFSFSSPDGAKLKKKMEQLEDAPEQRRAIWERVFAKVGLTSTDHATTTSIVRDWTGEHRHGALHKRLYAAVKRVLFGARVAPDADNFEDAVLVKQLPTRRARWRAILDELDMKHVPVPTHFDAIRGVKGEMFSRQIAKAWADEAATTVKVSHDELASWSLNTGTAKSFAGSDHGILLHWQIPMENTAFDQFTDDGSFAALFNDEHEVIAGQGKKYVILPKTDHTVFWHGTAYTYDRREDLFRAMRRDGVDPTRGAAEESE